MAPREPGCCTAATPVGEGIKRNKEQSQTEVLRREIKRVTEGERLWVTSQGSQGRLLTEGGL